MADGFLTNSASGGATFASDDDGTWQWPLIKLAWGPNGTFNYAGTAAPIPMQVIPVADQGCDIFRSIDLDETEEEVKASAGAVYGLWFSNLATSSRFLKFYNATAASVTVGTTTPVLTLALPGNASDDISGVISLPQGVKFSTAICVAATTGVADNDTGAPGANEVLVNIFYK